MPKLRSQQAYVNSRDFPIILTGVDIDGKRRVITRATYGTIRLLACQAKEATKAAAFTLGRVSRADVRRAGKGYSEIGIPLYPNVGIAGLVKTADIVGN